MRRIVAALLLCLSVVPVKAQLTQAQIDTIINTDVLSCGTGCVTAEVLRFVLQQMTQAAFQAQGGSPALGCGNANPNCIVPSAPPGTNTNQAASTAFVTTGIGNIFSTPNIWTALQTFGGGTPLSSVTGTPVAGAFQFIPSSDISTATPTVTVQRSTTYSAGATASPTFYALTHAALNGSSGWVDGIYSEVSVTSNAVAGSFAEAIRGSCYLASGITQSSLCTGGTFLALNAGASPAVSAALVGVEAEVDNFSSNSAAPTSWTASQPWRVSFVASSGNNDSTNIATAAFMVNPYTTSGYQSGFYCAPEASPGGAGNEIHYGCFVGQVTAPYGLDLSLGTWTTKAINATGFSVDNTGAVLLSKAGTMLNGLSSNTGATNLIEVQNSGTGTNTSTGAQFTAAISSLGAAYWFVEVVGGSGGSGLTSQMATGADLANGFFITTGAGPLVLNGASLVKVVSSTFNMPNAVGGTATKYVCSDASNNWFAQVAAC